MKNITTKNHLASSQPVRAAEPNAVGGSGNCSQLSATAREFRSSAQNVPRLSSSEVSVSTSSEEASQVLSSENDHPFTWKASIARAEKYQENLQYKEALDLYNKLVLESFHSNNMLLLKKVVLNKATCLNNMGMSHLAKKLLDTFYPGMIDTVVQIHNMYLNKEYCVQILEALEWCRGFNHGKILQLINVCNRISLVEKSMASENVRAASISVSDVIAELTCGIDMIIEPCDAVMPPPYMQHYPHPVMPQPYMSYYPHSVMQPPTRRFITPKQSWMQDTTSDGAATSKLNVQPNATSSPLADKFSPIKRKAQLVNAMQTKIEQYIDQMLPRIKKYGPNVIELLKRTAVESLDSLIQQYSLDTVEPKTCTDVLEQIMTKMYGNTSDHLPISGASGTEFANNYLFWNTLFQMGRANGSKNESTLNHPFDLHYKIEPIEFYVVRRAIQAVVLHAYIYENLITENDHDFIIGLAEFADTNGKLPRISIANYHIVSCPDSRRGLCFLVPVSFPNTPALYNSNNRLFCSSVRADAATGETDEDNMPENLASPVEDSELLKTARVDSCITLKIRSGKTLYLIHRRNEPIAHKAERRKYICFHLPEGCILMGDFNANLTTTPTHIKKTNALNGIDGIFLGRRNGGNVRFNLQILNNGTARVDSVNAVEVDLVEPQQVYEKDNDDKIIARLLTVN